MAAAGLCLAVVPAAIAQDVTINAPVVDRWMYPFGSQAGTRATAPAFASLNSCGTDDRFDDRDSQFLVTFDTSSVVASGQPADSYALASVRLTVRVDTDPNFGTLFTYDSTYDPVATFFAPGDTMTPCAADPSRVPDADPGRPIELFAVAFRNGFTVQTYAESSPFKPGSAFTPPWINVRNAYPIYFNAAGTATDASNHVKSRVEVSPLAIGIAPASVAPGSIPLDGTEFTFDIDLTNSGTRQYIQQSLSTGRLALLVTCMAFAEQEVVGSYPTFYTREATPNIFPAAAAPALHISLATQPACPADFNGDTILNPDDLSDYINAYFSQPPDPAADFNDDTIINPDDLSDYINAYFDGCS